MTVTACSEIVLGHSTHTDTPAPALVETQGWQPAPSGECKINCDASFNRCRSIATAAAIMRDSAGRVIDGLVSSFPASSTFVAEAHAVRMATMMAQAYDLNSTIVESDCKEVIQLGVDETVPPWEGLAILLDIRHLVSEGNLILKWTTRNNNKVANWVAQTYACNLLPLDWVANPPAALAAIISADVPSSLH
ncbi:hypothetical protein LOK49_LG14G00141 [Camellia lanceoleosa]|uniref:Uncharacterized protein n=1 Tax=Camellia lanceoleosa TaxID=1840588 RepID=A0ACC0FDU0_9ERIC|nr:hypothetical protein LOK49_LG14G00141 [Camellia lanceoleosa]